MKQNNLKIFFTGFFSELYVACHLLLQTPQHVDTILIDGFQDTLWVGLFVLIFNFCNRLWNQWSVRYEEWLRDMRTVSCVPALSSRGRRCPGCKQWELEPVGWTGWTATSDRSNMWSRTSATPSLSGEQTHKNTLYSVLLLLLPLLNNWDYSSRIGLCVSWTCCKALSWGLR